jgi:hopanoid biosynthesis associated protein HpnK
VPRLIVNADDFGLTSGVNRAIAELHQAGVLTSTTLMARAAAAEEAVNVALRTPSLAVGCHVVLVDGKPMLEKGGLRIPVDRQTGKFHSTLGEFLKRLYTGRIGAREIEAETAAQIAYLQGYGLRLTHIDTHKHTHMFPRVLRPVLRAARKAGIRAVRNPYEPEWSINATREAPELRRLEVIMLRRFEPAFRRIVAEEGMTTTDGAVGVLATGTIDIACLTALLSSMPEGTFELVTHPGYKDADLERSNTRLLASREIERNALLAILGFQGIELISFADLVREQESATDHSQ